jgi:hypothetical protein
MRDTRAVPPDAPEASTPDSLESLFPRVNRELLEKNSVAVIVRRTDGTIGVYKPEEWPTDGDGLIIGRKFPDGSFGWYSRPVAGTERRAMFVGRSIGFEPDGTITVDGKPAPPSVLRRLGIKVDEPDGG